VPTYPEFREIGGVKYPVWTEISGTKYGAMNCGVACPPCIWINVPTGERIKLGPMDEPCQYNEVLDMGGLAPGEVLYIEDSGVYWDSTNSRWMIESLSKDVGGVPTDIVGWIGTGPTTPDSPAGTYSKILGYGPTTMEVVACTEEDI